MFTDVYPLNPKLESPIDRSDEVEGISTYGMENATRAFFVASPAFSSSLFQQNNPLAGVFNRLRQAPCSDGALEMGVPLVHVRQPDQDIPFFGSFNRLRRQLETLDPRP